MSIALALQIFGLTIALAVVLSQIVTIACGKISKEYFAYKLVYMQRLSRDDASADGVKGMLADIAKQQAEKVS